MRSLRMSPPLAAMALAALALAPTPASAQSSLLVSDSASNQIFDYSYNSASDSYSLAGTISGNGISAPSGLVYSAATNSVYIANLGSPQILQYNLASQAVTPFVTDPAVGYANGLALDTAGNLFVSQYSGSGGPGSIREYSAAGTLLHTFSTGDGTFVGGILNGPTGLTSVGDTLYVSSSLGGEAFKFTVSGATATVSESFAPFNAPAGLAAAADGSVYITSFFATGAFPATGPGPGFTSFTPSGVGQFHLTPGLEPADLLVGPNGNLILSDFLGGTVAEYTTGGTFVKNLITGLPSKGPLYLLSIPTSAPGFETVPEPASVALLGLGGVALACRARFRRRRAAG